MKQRLHLARGLVADPPLLTLDEPTVGMDPVAAQDFRVLVDALRADGRTILLTTHDMAEAEAVCDRVSLVDHGRIIATRAPAGIGALISRYERVEARGVTALLMMAFCGVQVPIGYWPPWIGRIADIVPLTHLLRALRGLTEDASSAYVFARAALGLLVGVLWLVMAHLAFASLLHRGRRRGTVDFGP
ncbi:ATP-binding cassette domain-containing protein [Streptomyces johnsoniae]|uniref:hypothetical protein n=1 Tax=Streptomyces johnsoniae TaxID=3075532 RepID=UPI00374E1EE8